MVGIASEWLVAAVRAGSRGAPERAAIDLLAWHGELYRDVVGDHITILNPGHAEPRARIRWADIDPESVETPADRAIMRVAVSLADTRFDTGDPPAEIDLYAAIRDMTRAEAAAVARALLHAAWQHDAQVLIPDSSVASTADPHTPPEPRS